MITAHLPAGYLLARGIGWPGKAVMAAALIGSILPDLDLIWFYLVDQGSVHHHRYWPHIPAVWITLSGPVLVLANWQGGIRPAAMFFAAIWLHLLLDSLSGGIMWGWPVHQQLMRLVEVPPTQSHWLLSFILHWTFLVEIAIWIAAGFVFWRERKAA